MEVPGKNPMTVIVPFGKQNHVGAKGMSVAEENIGAGYKRGVKRGDFAGQRMSVLLLVWRSTYFFPTSIITLIVVSLSVPCVPLSHSLINHSIEKSSSNPPSVLPVRS